MTLTVTRENLASCQCRLQVEVDPATVNTTREAVVRDIRNRVLLPGFRRGKAPRKMVEREYKDTIRAQLMQRLVGEAYQQALEQEHIHPLSDPEFEDVELEEQKPLRFTAVLDVRPDVDLREYTGLALTRPSTEVTDGDVEEVLQSLQERHAEFIASSDKTAARGDVLLVDFTCTIDGEPFEGGSAENYSLQLGEGRMLPEFEQNLEGRKVGDEVDFDVHFPADYHSADLAGQTAQVHAMVKEVKVKRLLPLDDEFAKDIGDAETLDELKQKLRKDVEAYKTQQADAALRDQAMEKLLEIGHVDVPARLHERTRQRILAETEHRLRHRGLTEEHVAEQREAMQQHASEQAARQIRSSFLIDALAEREGLRATEDDVHARVREMTERDPAQAKVIRDFFGNPDQRANLRQQIAVEKVLNFLVANATITVDESAETAAAQGNET